MLPEDILNCISSIAEVVLKYPAVYKLAIGVGDPSSGSTITAIKCFTNVVYDALNKCKYPSPQASLAPSILPFNF